MPEALPLIVLQEAVFPFAGLMLHAFIVGEVLDVCPQTEYNVKIVVVTEDALRPWMVAVILKGSVPIPLVPVTKPEVDTVASIGLADVQVTCEVTSPVELSA
jgi:hypothetical protein